MTLYVQEAGREVRAWNATFPLHRPAGAGYLRVCATRAQSIYHSQSCVRGMGSSGAARQWPNRVIPLFLPGGVEPGEGQRPGILTSREGASLCRDPRAEAAETQEHYDFLRLLVGPEEQHRQLHHRTVYLRHTATVSGAEGRSGATCGPARRRVALGCAPTVWNTQPDYCCAAALRAVLISPSPPNWMQIPQEA